MKLLFTPFTVVYGLIAGLIGRRLGNYVWGRIDNEEAPKPTHRFVSWRKVLLSAAVQGAVFYIFRFVADRGLRTAIFSITGKWPGEQAPDPK